MGYMIAAYVMAVGGVILYGSALARERRALHRRLSQGDQSNPG